MGARQVRVEFKLDASELQRGLERAELLMLRFEARRLVARITSRLDELERKEPKEEQPSELSVHVHGPVFGADKRRVAEELADEIAAALARRRRRGGFL